MSNLREQSEAYAKTLRTNGIEIISYENYQERGKRWFGSMIIIPYECQEKAISLLSEDFVFDVDNPDNIHYPDWFKVYKHRNKRTSWYVKFDESKSEWTNAIEIRFIYN